MPEYSSSTETSTDAWASKEQTEEQHDLSQATFGKFDRVSAALIGVSAGSRNSADERVQSGTEKEVRQSCAGAYALQSSRKCGSAVAITCMTWCQQ